MPQLDRGHFATVRKPSRVLPQRDCGPTSKPPIYKGLGSANPYIADPRLSLFLRTVGGSANARRKDSKTRVRRHLFADPKPAWIKAARVGPQTGRGSTRARWAKTAISTPFDCRHTFAAGCPERYAVSPGGCPQSAGTRGVPASLEPWRHPTPQQHAMPAD